MPALADRRIGWLGPHAPAAEAGLMLVPAFRHVAHDIRSIVVAWCRERLAGFKRPRAIAVMPEGETPRNAKGKTLHRAARDGFARLEGT